MAEPFDVYSDGFTISTNPWGTNLVFGLLPAEPSPGFDAEATHLGTVRVSNEYLKVVAFALWRNVMLHEESIQAELSISPQVLDQLGIPREVWDSFWAQTGG